MPAQPPAPESEANEPEGRRPDTADEAWERFVAECESPAGSAPREPSARARMVTERLRRADGEAARRQRTRRWGRKRQPEPWQPEGWRTGPAWQEMEGGRRARGGRPGRAGMALGAGVTALALLYALDPALVRSWLPGGAGGTGPDAPLPAETAAPTTGPEEEFLPDHPTVERPFAGSPAKRWARGADAIEVPETTAVGGVPAAEIRAALERTKRFLVASNLDRDVLYGAEPAEALALLDPLMGKSVDRIRKSLDKPTEKDDPTWLFTRFDRDEVRLAGETVKVRGRMEVTENDQGVPRIRADYTFVYPLVRAAGGEDVARAVVRRVLDVDVLHGPRWKHTEGTLWMYGHNADIANDTCDEHDGFIHPQFVADRHAGPATGPERDPYDRSRPVEEWTGKGECLTASRT
ncbi:hypothetical protein [Streptomyces radiopugnans]|uniref:Uncharacterized protein n=1 Tax=Streptomyces radiopugnans TaxID=403935 RepID=A0A1H9DRM8_9ACTN|nr:hypothetical protein [Streptomyces radiopugnans]SEQ16164.1 hypothetical protein SAMN05216481_104250 [Streptomyces radiopugnans]